MKNFIPMKNKIFVTNMEHGIRVTKNGIIIPDDNMKESGIRARWAQVKFVGSGIPEDDVKVGDWLLLKHGHWSLGFDVELDSGKVRLWEVKYPDGVLLVSDKPDMDYKFNDSQALD